MGRNREKDERDTEGSKKKPRYRFPANPTGRVDGPEEHGYGNLSSWDTEPVPNPDMKGPLD